MIDEPKPLTEEDLVHAEQPASWLMGDPAARAERAGRLVAEVRRLRRFEFMWRETEAAIERAKVEHPEAYAVLNRMAREIDEGNP